MSYRPPHFDETSILVDPPHPCWLDEQTLLRNCRITTGRVSGPGGQHRNRVETAVFITHTPTGIEAQGTERRSQIENRAVAVMRLRVKLAVQVRTLTGRDGMEASPLWTSRRSDRKIRVNETHWDFPAILAEALDHVVAHRYDISTAATILGVSTSQLAKLLLIDKSCHAKVSAGRVKAGLRPLAP